MFFLVLLPPIIFESGYNLHKVRCCYCYFFFINLFNFSIFSSKWKKFLVQKLKWCKAWAFASFKASLIVLFFTGIDFSTFNYWHFNTPLPEFNFLPKKESKCMKKGKWYFLSKYKKGKRATRLDGKVSVLPPPYELWKISAIKTFF